MFLLLTNILAFVYQVQNVTDVSRKQFQEKEYREVLHYAVTSASRQGMHAQLFNQAAKHSVKPLTMLM